MDSPRRILDLALECGFDLAALTPLRPPDDGPRFRRWLAAGRHADMDWLERNEQRIVDPRRLDPSARTLLVVGLGHARPAVALDPERGGGRVARYAAGRDYHNLMTRRLRKLRRRVEDEGLCGGGRTVVDAGPLLERAHAAEAGLGFASKAANLLHPVHGPWFFLGELLLDATFELPAPSPPAGSCGTCTACLDACPTGAILEPGAVDARLCLSYHTIENRGAVPHELRRALGGWAFGCDVCSEVCPWGADAPDARETFGTHPVVERRGLVDWLTTPPDALKAELVGSPLQRAGVDGLARNAALVLGGGPSDAGRDALARALEQHPAGPVRAAAYWGLAAGHAGDAGVAGRLDAARARETDDRARADMRVTDRRER